MELLKPADTDGVGGEGCRKMQKSLLSLNFLLPGVAETGRQPLSNKARFYCIV